MILEGNFDFPISNYRKIIKRLFISTKNKCTDYFDFFASNTSITLFFRFYYIITNSFIITKINYDYISIT